jgi:hypothetical protein
VKPGAPPHIYSENGICTFLLVWRYKKNAIFWAARNGKAFMPTIIEYLKPGMTRIFKTLKMDLKPYKSDYQAPKYDTG